MYSRNDIDFFQQLQISNLLKLLGPSRC